MSDLYRLLASVPRGFADLLAMELKALGAKDIRERGNAVQFTGDLRVAYRACLESWLASRIYLEIGRFEAASAEGFYAGLRDLDWVPHIDPDRTLACEFTGQHPAMNNSHFAALRIKDAICDQLRERCGRRPNVSAERPDVRIHVHAAGPQLTVSVDLAGESLHRRGWRIEGGIAPLRENVAAGVLCRAEWPALAIRGGLMLDPLCGVGTLVIEAARMAAGQRAAEHRHYFGFLGWAGHDEALWQQVRSGGGPASHTPRLVAVGRDRDRRRIAAAEAHARAAGVEGWVRFEVGDLDSCAAAMANTAAVANVAAVDAGLVCTNPPWGLRLEDQDGARAVHRQLGAVLRELGPWQAAVLTGDPSLGLELGMRARRVHTVYNGAVECRLLRFDLSEATVRDMRPRQQAHPPLDASLMASEGAQMFANRLRKNRKQLAAWLRRESVECFRLYDADMPEYAFAIDVYRGRVQGAEVAEEWLMVQEYAAPAQIPEETLRRRRNEALAGLVQATDIPIERVRLRTRKRRKRGEQYLRSELPATILTIKENELRFRVSLGEYLDTGIFLDHRPIRRHLGQLARGKRFLNLFAYTGTASVHAAAGGALATTSVDLSLTYLEWARDNFRLNDMQAVVIPRLASRQGGQARPDHALVQADVAEWLSVAVAEGLRYDLIFCDPPTFSNSKRMEGVWDVQRDHLALIEQCLGLLAPEGLLIFSTNAQRFVLDPALHRQCQVRDISRSSIPADFARNDRIHQCFEIRLP